jgi:hypothetical protein
MFPMANATGNTFVLKPSERDPGACMYLAELAIAAGLPAGCLNIIHGAHDAVNFICDAPEIKAISFVGSNRAGEYIHARGTGNGKRVQANLGAKNHATIMPDADKEATLNALTGPCAVALTFVGTRHRVDIEHLLERCIGLLYGMQVLRSVLLASDAWLCQSPFSSVKARSGSRSWSSARRS